MIPYKSCTGLERISTSLCPNRASNLMGAQRNYSAGWVGGKAMVTVYILARSSDAKFDNTIMLTDCQNAR